MPKWECFVEMAPGTAQCAIKVLSLGSSKAIFFPSLMVSSISEGVGAIGRLIGCQLFHASNHHRQSFKNPTIVQLLFGLPKLHISRITTKIRLLFHV